MTLLELKKHIESLPSDTSFEYSLSIPFSWRGAYDEVAFNIEERKSTKLQLLEKILIAYRDTFFGYKGGEYKYDDDTKVHFEEGVGKYTDGEYCEELIFKLLRTTEVKDSEKRLINLMFKTETL